MAHAARVCVVYKRTTYQTWVREQGGRLFDQLAQRDPEAAQAIWRAHEEHLHTIAEARRLLKSHPVEARFRHKLDRRTLEGVDLVITIGGDGTLLFASHFVCSSVPVLAINSAPSRSVGHFCAADRESFGDVLSQALSGNLEGLDLNRMQVSQDGDVLSTRVLNDLLFCHQVPAETSRYALSYGGTEERQKSSGVWVGPAAGSTAAMHSAGGTILPMTSRNLQYVVREPYPGQSAVYQRLRGLLAPGETLVLRSEMDSGRIYIDGSHRVHQVGLGCELKMCVSKEPLRLLGLSTEGATGL